MLHDIISQKSLSLTFILLVSLVFVNSSFAESEITRGQGIRHPSLVETPDGTLHCAYAEGLKLKYAVSTDGGQTWTIDTIPTPTAYYYGCCGIKYCQLAIDSNGSVYILYTINTIPNPDGNHRKWDIYCSTNVSGVWEYELVKEGWYPYSGYGYVKWYNTGYVIVDYQDKVHLFAVENGWWSYGSPLHELVLQSDGTWNDVEVVYIPADHPDYITMRDPRASINSTSKILVTFVNPCFYPRDRSYRAHDLNLIEGDSNQSWGSYVTKNNDANYAASVIDAQDNLYVVYVGADHRSVKYMKNWGDVEVITTVESPLAIYNPDIHVDVYGNLTVTAITWDTDNEITTDVWYAKKEVEGSWSEPQPMSTDFEPSKFSIPMALFRLDPRTLIRGSLPGFYTSPKAVCVYEVDDETQALVFMDLGETEDTTPPSAITDLATSNPTPDSITLTWTAPGDDEDVGTASEYDIRYSTSPIDEGNWDSAIQVHDEPPPQPAGSSESFDVTGLLPETTYYFAMKTADEVPNWSELSNVTSVNLLLTQYEPILYMHPNDRFFPMNVEAFVHNCSLWEAKAIGDDKIKNDGEVSLGDLGVYTDEDVYLQFVEDLDWLKTPDPEKASALYDSIEEKPLSYYGRITYDGDYKVLQYYFFYAFNDWGTVSDGLNNHEGDWEMVAIFLRDDVPEFAAYSSHHNEGPIVRRRWNDVEKQGNHPIVYVAQGSHANYFVAGDINVPVPLPFLYFDHTSESGEHIGPGQLKEWQHRVIFQDDNLPDWVKLYKGMWGVNYQKHNLRIPTPEASELSKEKVASVPKISTDGPPGPMYSVDSRVTHKVKDSEKWHQPVHWAGLDARTIVITTDKDSYHEGDSMEISADIINPGDAVPDALFGLFIYGVSIDFMELMLVKFNMPADWDFHGVVYTIGSLPPLSPGVYCHIGVLGSESQGILDYSEVYWTFEAVASTEEVAILKKKVEKFVQNLTIDDLKNMKAVSLDAIVPEPEETVLMQNVPNPFNPETWIPYQLKDSADVTISIYDVSGRIVRRLELGQKKAGAYVTKDKAVYWDGCNNAGEKVSSGLYFYTLQAGNYTATKRMLILK